MIPILRIMVPVMALALIIVGVVVVRAQHNRTLGRRAKMRELERRAEHLLENLTAYQTCVINVRGVVAPDVDWGSQELMREAVHTHLTNLSAEVRALINKRNADEFEADHPTNFDEIWREASHGKRRRDRH